MVMMGLLYRGRGRADRVDCTGKDTEGTEFYREHRNFFSLRLGRGIASPLRSAFAFSPLHLCVTLFASLR